MAKGQCPREKQSRSGKNRSDPQQNDDSLNDCCDFLAPKLKTLLYTCSGTDVFDKKPNFYNVAQIQQNVIKLLERPKS